MNKLPLEKRILILNMLVLGAEEFHEKLLTGMRMGTVPR